VLTRIRNFGKIACSRDILAKAKDIFQDFKLNFLFADDWDTMGFCLSGILSNSGRKNLRKVTVVGGQLNRYTAESEQLVRQSSITELEFCDTYLMDHARNSLSGKQSNLLLAATNNEWGTENKNIRISISACFTDSLYITDKLPGDHNIDYGEINDFGSLILISITASDTNVTKCYISVDSKENDSTCEISCTVFNHLAQYVYLDYATVVRVYFRTISKFIMEPAYSRHRKIIEIDFP
jgi:hypothetical protein